MTWDNQMEVTLLNWLTGKAAVQPVGPLKIRLMTANGTGAAAGTQATGDLYSAQTATWSASTAAAAPDADNSVAVSALTGTVSFGGVSSSADVNLTGSELWDSSTPTPRRLSLQSFASPFEVLAGDGLVMPSGTVAFAAPYDLDIGVQRALLDWLLGQPAAAQPVAPFLIRPVLPDGSNDTVASEHPGDLWEPQEVVFGVAVSASGKARVLNTNMISFSGLDSAGTTTDLATVRAYEVWDSSPTPRRVLYHESAAFTPAVGEAFFLAAGSLDIQFGDA